MLPSSVAESSTAGQKITRLVVAKSASERMKHPRARRETEPDQEQAKSGQFRRKLKWRQTTWIPLEQGRDFRSLGSFTQIQKQTRCYQKRTILEGEVEASMDTEERQRSVSSSTDEYQRSAQWWNWTKRGQKIGKTSFIETRDSVLYSVQWNLSESCQETACR